VTGRRPLGLTLPREHVRDRGTGLGTTLVGKTKKKKSHQQTAAFMAGPRPSGARRSYDDHRIAGRMKRLINAFGRLAGLVGVVAELRRNAFSPTAHATASVKPPPRRQPPGPGVGDGRSAACSPSARGARRDLRSPGPCSRRAGAEEATANDDPAPSGWVSVGRGAGARQARGGASGNTLLWLAGRVIRIHGPL